MNKIKKWIKLFLPPIILTFRRKIRDVIWIGDFINWEAAQKQCKGYNQKHILEKVCNALIKVKNGDALYERDSFLFYKQDYEFPLLTTLYHLAYWKKGIINIADFGGSLGSTYYQNLSVLKNFTKVTWTVIEQEHFVECGKMNFENEQLHFVNTLKECKHSYNPDLLILSSVLQYIEDYQVLIENILIMNFEYIFIDRTPFSQNSIERITVQKVSPTIYEASYPCRFFNEKEFLKKFTKKYEIIYIHQNKGYVDIEGVDYKGFLLKIIKN